MELSRSQYYKRGAQRQRLYQYLGGAHVARSLRRPLQPLANGSAQRADKLPPRALAMLTRLKVHTHFGNPCRDVETGCAFDADWLQGNRVSRPADKHVGADTDTDRPTCRHSTIRSGERSRCG